MARLALATADGLDDGLRQDVELTALLHDIGKLALPYRLLQKADGLDDGDWTLVRTHSVWGERLCLSHAFPARIARLVRATHERWDGRGYPDGLAGEEIGLPARIVFCADAFDAMTSARPYRPAMPVDEALAELRAGAGSQFDPVIATRLIGVVKRLEGRLRRTARDRDPRAVFALRSLPAG